MYLHQAPYGLYWMMFRVCWWLGSADDDESISLLLLLLLLLLLVLSFTVVTSDIFYHHCQYSEHYHSHCHGLFEDVKETARGKVPSTPQLPFREPQTLFEGHKARNGDTLQGVGLGCATGHWRRFTSLLQPQGNLIPKGPNTKMQGIYPKRCLDFDSQYRNSTRLVF